jgi:hypothetical protein
MKALALAIFHRDDPDSPPPLFCGPEANQPQSAVELDGGAVIDAAWRCDLPNLAAWGALLDDLGRDGAYVIVHPGQGRARRDGRRVLVLEVVDA